MSDYEKEMRSIDRQELSGLILGWLGWSIIALSVGAMVGK